MTAPLTTSSPAPPVAGLEVPDPGVVACAGNPGGLTHRRDAAALELGSASAAAPRVIGLDLSLTATGLAGVGWCHLIASKHDGDDWPHRHHRLRKIRDEVLEFAMTAQLVVVEGPSYASVSRSTWDRAGLWWSVVSVMQSCDVPYAVVSPAQRLMYLTGRGQVKAGQKTKGVVLDAVIRRYPTYDVSGDDNLADAVAFLAMGCRAVGHPIEDTLPATHLRGMDKVEWPEVAW